ncbi:MAG: hypothetical protein II583_01525, partial [Oscillospiraceae bacterium]|nr:hypothetical protein [Oscillospiraceae bacterium]
MVVGQYRHFYGILAGLARRGIHRVNSLEHVILSNLHVVNNKGPHGLPLIGRADWNDCLNLNCYSDTPDESFQTFSNPNAPDDRIAESVLIAGMFVSI